jgi:hypothetical protein
VSEQPRVVPINDKVATLGAAVAEAIVRLRRLWPRNLDTPEAIAEYRRVLTELKDTAIVEKTVTAVIDEWTNGYAPPPGLFVAKGGEFLATKDWRRHTSSDKGLRWVEAEPDHRDPPGTIRWIVIQPNGQRVPAGARSADDIGAGR